MKSLRYKFKNRISYRRALSCVGHGALVLVVGRVMGLVHSVTGLHMGGVNVCLCFMFTFPCVFAIQPSDLYSITLKGNTV